ncbi:MAG: transporter substrate-binding domain-containing protein, partial [Deltaproteobacteria bacterium]
MAERLGIAGRFKHYQLVTMVVAAFVVVCYSPISESFDLPDKASASQRLKTIIVNNYHPYTFMNNKGEPDGFSVEIARAVAKVMDLELEIRADRWDLAIKELEAGSIDLLPMMAYTAERDKTFDFSVPHTIAFDAIFHKKGATGLGTLKELSGKTVIVMNRDIAHSYLISSGLSKSMALN